MAKADAATAVDETVDSTPIDPVAEPGDETPEVIDATLAAEPVVVPADLDAKIDEAFDAVIADAEILSPSEPDVADAPERVPALADVALGDAVTVVGIASYDNDGETVAPGIVTRVLGDGYVSVKAFVNRQPDLFYPRVPVFLDSEDAAAFGSPAAF